MLNGFNVINGIVVDDDGVSAFRLLLGAFYL